MAHYKYLHYKCWRCDSEYDVKCSPEINKAKLSSLLLLAFYYCCFYIYFFFDKLKAFFAFFSLSSKIEIKYGMSHHANLKF